MKKVLRKFRQLSSGNVTSIVATLVKIRGQLNKSIEFNNREIVHAEGNIDKSGCDGKGN